MPLLVSRLTDTAKLPTRSHSDDAGLDLYADIKAALYIMPGERALIPTGVSVALEPWTVGQIWPRSGMAVNYGMATMAGIIDSGYRGEIKVALINHGSDRVKIEYGDRIAQLVVVLLSREALVELDELPPAERDGGGFGSSGA